MWVEARAALGIGVGRWIDTRTTLDFPVGRFVGGRILGFVVGALEGLRVVGLLVEGTRVGNRVGFIVGAREGARVDLLNVGSGVGRFVGAEGVSATNMRAATGRINVRSATLPTGGRFSVDLPSGLENWMSKPG